MAQRSGGEKKRNRNPILDKYAAQRRRAKAELTKLNQVYNNLSTTQRAGARGQAIKQQQEKISELSQKTYQRKSLRGSEYNALEAREASNALESFLGRKGERGRKQQQARRDRIYRQQIRTEEAGGESALFGGAGKRYHLERIFYISTQQIWADKPNEERDKAIMDALGVSSLEEAYDLVILQNADALAKMKELGLTGDGWETGYNDLAPFITDIADYIADQL